MMMMTIMIVEIDGMLDWSMRYSTFMFF